jgi:hypothetical protein
MNMQEFLEAMETAVTEFEGNGITGWGINNPDQNLFDMIEVSPPHGCFTSNCNHISHDPANSDRKLIAKKGWVITYLDSDGQNDYYAITTENRLPGDQIQFVVKETGGSYYDHVYFTNFLPNWVLVNN